MTRTIEITDNAAAYLLTDAHSVATLRDYIAGALGEYADEYDLDGLEAEYRAALADALPEGASINGQMIYATGPIDQDAARAVAEGVDFWAIAEGNAR